MKTEGWEHDVLGWRPPSQMEKSYRRVIHDPTMTTDRYLELISKHPAEVIHVHNEPNWPVAAVKEAAGGRPVIFNVHDVSSSRPHHPLDVFEEDAFESADAHVFISEEQRMFAGDMGLCIDKPYAVLPNFASSSTFVEKRLLPHIGGVVYMGGAQKRGENAAWRDLSQMADALDGQLHIYPGNPGVDYGIVHPAVLEYKTLFHRLSQHDWGLTGNSGDIPAWTHSVPNKVFEYMAAGLPVIAINNPLIRPLCEAGCGIYLDSISQLPAAAKVDPEPYRKVVMELRGNYTMERNVSVLRELYEAVLDA